jgi:hypothetical protein
MKFFAKFFPFLYKDTMKIDVFAPTQDLRTWELHILHSDSLDYPHIGKERENEKLAGSSLRADETKWSLDSLSRQKGF